mgnify:CR=1 FL=1|jgi:hypothetical protein
MKKYDYLHMNLKIVCIMAIFIAFVCISGFFILEQNENNNSKNSIHEIDVNSLIHVTDKSSKLEIKNNLINYIWKQNNLPESESIKIENNIIDVRYNDLKNLNKIDKFLIEMEYDVNSIVYHFTPLSPNGKLIIYHQGHSGGFFEGKNIIEFFLEKNYSVVAFSMPLKGMNSQPVVDLSNIGKLKLESHNQLEFLESESFSPIKFFVEPIVVVINYFDNHYDFNSYYMVGISGGGWTATIAPAIDERITQSYSVAGSYPMFLRNSPENVGDYEQHTSDLYELANYLDLYVMASTGQDRKFIQIFNKYDPCCFSGTNFDAYEENIKNTVNNMETGYFDIFLDDTHKEHIISEESLEIIISEMEK